MNCKAFQDRLHEYLDEALDAEVQDAAREHLRQCDACRHALLREQAFAESVGQSLGRATAGFSLRPGMRQNILRALETKATTPNAWRRAWQSFISIPLRAAGALAMLLGALILFSGIQFFRPRTMNATSKTIPQTGHYSCVINVPIQTRTHVFRWQNNTIEDAIVSSTSVGRANFSETSEPPSPKPSSNSL